MNSREEIGAHVLVVHDEGEPVEDDQRHEEARDRHSEKGDGRGDAVAPSVLIDGADDAEADADQRGQQVARACDGERAPEPLVKQITDRLVVDEGFSEIAAEHHSADPPEILFGERLVETEILADLIAQDDRLLVAQAALAARHGRGVVGIVALRGLEQNEGDDADHKQQADRGDRASDQESDHPAIPLDWRNREGITLPVPFAVRA